jgi:FtsP/CotA-like multicopper oxidase with cupredoxin domain
MVTGGGAAACDLDHTKADTTLPNNPAPAPTPAPAEPHAMPMPTVVSMEKIDYAANGWNPHDILTDWDTGIVSIENGKTVRTWHVIVQDKEIEIAKGVKFQAWTYNGRIPGPTFRCTEGDHLRIIFINTSYMDHSIHFHGIHNADMDGAFEMVKPGEKFTYEFDAYPFGLHPYHCHAFPIEEHIHRGMYGALVIDPPAKLGSPRTLGTEQNKQWQEFIMVMNAFDTTGDSTNDIYAVNTIAFCYTNEPIIIDKKRPVRCYVVNMTEFDLLNSFHLHANMFDYYDVGTQLEPTFKKIDTVMQCQGQRGILEFSFKNHKAGKYMFHAHVSEFTDLGWMGIFDVRD